jgi:carboxypeptidase Taq
MTNAYEQLRAHHRRLSLLGSAGGVLGWDQQTMLPPGGAAFRGEQLSYLAELRHEMFTDPRVGEWLSECETDSSLTADPVSPAAVNLREIRHSYDRATRLPSTLVAEYARVTSAALTTWKHARANDDYGSFAPALQRIIELNIEKARCFGWADDGEPWDALADGFERGMTAAMVAAVFTPLRDQLAALIDQLLGTGAEPSRAFDRVTVPIEQQRRFVEWVIARIGFDFDRGRLDLATHPFCSGFHPGDVRLTTRFHDDLLSDALGSTMHEAGHGLYEQGLPVDRLYEPSGSAAGLSIHESQSRLWENQVGRSLAFWQWCFPKLREFFGDAFGDLSAEDAFASANKVERSLIRVECDEATYNMHIMIRFELERMMLRGDLDASDLPDAWDQRYREYLGIEVPDNRRGCLQDMHWSQGAMGYFPTYTLGNLYGAQFFEAACDELGDLPGMIGRGEFAPLLQWLNENIHAHGRLYSSDTLCEKVTGKPVSAEPLMRHLRGKLEPLYGL